jgi:hypothetical protein
MLLRKAAVMRSLSKTKLVITYFDAIKKGYKVHRDPKRYTDQRRLKPMTEKFHSCFISYRHPASKGSREEKLIGHVVRAITDHVEMYTHDYPVYFDEKRLIPGYQYDERLAEAICRSACMVIVYWPAYLESDYCKKEIEAMLDIEKRRRLILGQKLHGCRLFIPIILRGNFNDLPDSVRNNCQYLDYKAQATKPHFNIGDDDKVSDELFHIAEYIKTLCDKMKEASDKLFGECQKYLFPEIQALQAKQGKIQPAPPQPFPGH